MYIYIYIVSKSEVELTISGITVLNISKPCWNYIEATELYRKYSENVNVVTTCFFKRKPFFCLILNFLK